MTYESDTWNLSSTVLTQGKDVMRASQHSKGQKEKQLPMGWWPRFLRIHSVVLWFKNSIHEFGVLICCVLLKTTLIPSTAILLLACSFAFPT